MRQRQRNWALMSRGAVGLGDREMEGLPGSRSTPWTSR